MFILHQKNKGVNPGFSARCVIFLKKKRLIAAIFSLVYIIYFSFGFFHISEFITADEHFWVYNRVHTYWHSVFSPEKWQRTRLSDKPGVTVALVSGIVLLKESNPYASITLASKERPEDTSVVKYMFTIFRIPILIFNALFSLYLFWIVKKLTGNFWIGLWSFILMLLSPILLGISQITNADAVMWPFSAAALLSFLAYLQTEEKKFLFLSPLFLGMSLLTKLAAVIFFPFLFLVMLAFIFYKFARWEKEKIEIHKKIIKLSLAYLAAFAGSLLVFAIFMPAVFVDHQLFFNYTIGYSSMKTIAPVLLLAILLILGDAVALKSFFGKKIIGAIAPLYPTLQKIIPAALFIFFVLALFNWNANQFILNPDNVLNYKSDELSFLKTSSLFQKLLYQFYPFVFSLVPLVFLSILFVWAKFVLKKINSSFFALTLSFFALVYYAALVKLDLPSTIRYSIALYPMAAILAAIGIYEFFTLKKFEKINKIWVTLGIIIASAVSLWQIKPFYFNYTSDLLPKKYSIASAWGYGGYEAAQFLNQLENAKELNVWTDYYGFRNFFMGSSKTDYIQNEKDRPIDYLILTRQGQIKFNYWCNRQKNVCRNKYVPAGNYYSADNPIWEMYIDGRPNNFIKIFKVN